MRTKVTLFLLFLNVALFFFIFGFEREWRIRDEAQQARRRVLGSETANIHSIEIAGAGFAEPLRLRRTNEAWMLTSPVEWPANPHAVSRILNELQFLEHETSFSVGDLTAAGQSLADYGLEDPALTVAFSAGAAPGDDAAAAERVSLAIGAETAVGNRLYLLSADRERVHVVSRSLADSLRITLDQLRADTCFTIPVFEVRSLNLQTAGPANVRVRLRREGNQWSIEAPIVARASKTATELAINGLNSLRTRDFLGSARARSELVTRAGTNNPSLRITLEGNNRRETLLLGQPVTDSSAGEGPRDTVFYAQIEDRDAIFTVAVPPDLLETLRNAQEELRDPRVLPLEGREVTAVSIAAPNRPELTLQRLEPTTGARPAPANWQIVRAGSGASGPQTYPADREQVQGLLQYLSLLSAEQFLRDVPSDAELENWGLTRPERTIRLTLAPEPGSPTAPPSVTLLLGVASEQEGRVYAKLAHQTFVYLVDPEILNVTPVVPRTYRERLLRELPADARITGLTLTNLESDEVVYARSLASNETWQAASADETPERREALAQLRDQLRTLRARRFVFDAFTSTIPVQGEHRPWAWRLDATLALPGGGPEQPVSSLFLAPRTGGGTQWVGSPEYDVVFEAEQPLLDALWVLTYGSRDPGPPRPPGQAPDAETAPES